MPPAKKPEGAKSRTNARSAPLNTVSGNSKRKHANADNTATNGSENDRTRKQPRQDNSPNRGDSSTYAVGSNEILFGMPSLSFQSPFEGEMCLEVATPSIKYEKGCIRLHGPQGHWNMDAMFSLPFTSIEDIIIRNRKLSGGKKKAYEVLIVPTSATGLAPVSQKHSQIISFILPDQKIDAHVYGSMKSGVDKNTLVLNLLKKALNERLAEFNKTVIDLSQEDKKLDPIFHIETTLNPVSATKLEKKTKGLLQIFDNGALFRTKSVAVTLWIPARQLNDVRLVFASEMGGGIIGMEIVLSVPYPPK